MGTTAHIWTSNLYELVLSFYHIEGKDKTQAVRLDGNDPDPQSHLTSPQRYSLVNKLTTEHCVEHNPTYVKILKPKHSIHVKPKAKVSKTKSRN